MTTKRLCSFGIAILCAAIPVQAQAPADETTSPGESWETVAPESVSFSSVYLEALTTFLKAHHTTSMVVAVHGKLIYQYGDTRKVSVIASVRKSVLSMLYGNYVLSGKIDTQKTVKQIGLEDKQPFLPIEENSKLEYLLAGRSGIYITAGKPDAGGPESLQPRRGTQVPGTYYTYNEWDFNAAGSAFEKLTGKDIYDALETDLTRPIGMQDFDRARQKKISNLPFSVHPQYPMYLSTRDMARLGQLMLRHGNWNGKQVMPDDWVRYSTILWTPFQEMNPLGLREYTRPDRWGFGLMWFVWDEPGYLDHVWLGPMQGAFIAMGSGGQYIAVLPRYDMVIAHKVDFETAGGQINPIEWDAILNLVLASDCFGNCPTPPQ